MEALAAPDRFVGLNEQIHMKEDHKNDISIGEGLWIKFIDTEGRCDSAYDIDETIEKVSDFWKATETQCVAGCCGIDAFDFWPEEIEKAAKQFNVEEILALFKGINDQLLSVEAGVFVSKRLNNYFDKKMFLELLKHIITNL